MPLPCATEQLSLFSERSAPILPSERLHGSNLASGLPLRWERSCSREGLDDRLGSDVDAVVEGILNEKNQV